jgi:hypothetical protein
LFIYKYFPHWGQEPKPYRHFCQFFVASHIYSYTADLLQWWSLENAFSLSHDPIIGTLMN